MRLIIVEWFVLTLSVQDAAEEFSWLTKAYGGHAANAETDITKRTIQNLNVGNDIGFARVKTLECKSQTATFEWRGARIYIHMKHYTF